MLSLANLICQEYTGSLSEKGASQVQPDGTYYYSSTSGRHKAYLQGPSNADFDLYLYKWSGTGWEKKDSSTYSLSNEEIEFTDNTEGYYLWWVYSYDGSGEYSLCMTSP